MVEEVSAEELKRKLDAGEDVQVIDIRPASQFDRGHVPGAENVPFHEFTRAVEERDWGDRIVVVCPKGESSRQACMLLESYEGIDADETWIANLEGGYRDWEYDLAEGEND